MLVKKMVSILEEPTIRQHAVPITVEQYHYLAEAGLISEKVELLKGVIVEKIAKSPLHAWTVNYLVDQFRASLGPEYLVRKEDPLTLSDSEPEPDISIVRGSSDEFLQKHPSSAELVIEVAVSSFEVDREKIEIYASGGIKEYWIVLPESRRVEVFTKPAEGVYQSQQEFSTTGSITSNAIPILSVDLETLFP